jgi:hypothetical protein
MVLTIGLKEAPCLWTFSKPYSLEGLVQNSMLMGAEVYSSIFSLLPILSEISGQAIIYFATCFHAAILLGLFDPEDGGVMFLRNIG